MFRCVALLLVLLAPAAQAAGQDQLCKGPSPVMTQQMQPADDRVQEPGFTISIDGVKLPPDDGTLAFVPPHAAQGDCPATS